MTLIGGDVYPLKGHIHPVQRFRISDKKMPTRREAAAKFLNNLFFNWICSVPDDSISMRSYALFVAREFLVGEKTGVELESRSEEDSETGALPLRMGA